VLLLSGYVIENEICRKNFMLYLAGPKICMNIRKICRTCLPFYIQALVPLNMYQETRVQLPLTLLPMTLSLGLFDLRGILIGTRFLMESSPVVFMLRRLPALQKFVKRTLSSSETGLAMMIICMHHIPEVRNSLLPSTTLINFQCFSH
jgi:hypothetical protein